jgi:hypothetical protein
MESHDEERVGYKTSQWGNWNMALNPRLRAVRAGTSAAFVLLAPGPKMIWQFGEMDYDVSIDQNGRTGKKPLHWEYLEQECGQYVHNMYSNILALRGYFPQIFSGVNGTANFSYTINNSLSNLREYIYTSDSVNIWLLGNFSGDTITKTITLTVLDIAGKQWYNYLEKQPVSVTDGNIKIPPHRFMLLTDTLTPLVETYQDLDVSNEEIVLAKHAESVNVYPNPVATELYISKAGYYKIYSMQGECVLKGKVQKNGKINVAMLSKGTYIIETGGQSAKFIKP